MEDIILNSIKHIHSLTGKFDMEKISEDLIKRHKCSVEDKAIKKRIDEFKKSPDYKMGNKGN